MYKLLILSIVSSFLIVYCSSSQQKLIDSVDISDSLRVRTFAIMPFEDYETYPYTTDRVREALIFALMEKGYQMGIDQDNWKKLEELDFQLINMNSTQAAKVAKLLETDMIIFGHSDFRSGLPSRRQQGLYSQKVIEKPVVIKVYDVSSEEIILRERLQTRSDWGLNHSTKEIRDLVREFVHKLQAMGYIN